MQLPALPRYSDQPDTAAEPTSETQSAIFDNGSGVPLSCSTMSLPLGGSLPMSCGFQRLLIETIGAVPCDLHAAVRAGGLEGYWSLKAIWVVPCD